MWNSTHIPLTSLPSHYVNAYNGDALRIVAIVMIVLQIVFVLLRYLAKVVGSNPLGLDDLLLVPALLLCTGLDTSALVSLDIAGLGHHTAVIEDTAPGKMRNWQKMLIVTPILYSAAVAVSKLVLLVFYTRIFITKFQRIATYTIMGFVIATAVADIITTGFQCIPLERFWDRTVPGHCFNYNMFYRYGSLPNPITDILMLALPAPAVWKLRCSLKVKFGLTFTFLTGSIGLIAALLRTYAFFRHNALGDATWSGGFLYIWIILEPGCYLIASCLVRLRPLLAFLAGKRTDSSIKQSRTFTIFRRPFSSARRISVPSVDRAIPLIRRDVEFTVIPLAKSEVTCGFNEDEEIFVGP